MDDGAIECGGVAASASIVMLIDATAKTTRYLDDVKNAPKDRASLVREATSLLAFLTHLRYHTE